MSRAIAGITINPARLALLGGIIAVVVAAIWFREQLNLESLHAHANRLNGTVVFIGLLLLPLVGFPVSMLHAVAGAKFGFGLGLVLVAVSIAFQLVASYAIVHLAPDFFARRFAWLHDRLPPATHRSLALFTMLLPGAPYFAQNYVLAVVGVPLRILFVYGFPIHVARSIIGVIFGEWSDHMTPGRIAICVLYAVSVTVVCALAFRRLRAQLHSRPPAAGDRKRPE